MSNQPFEVFIDEEKLAEHVFNELIYLGYAPKMDECEDIAAILFDYLVNLAVIEPLDDEKE